MNDKVKNVSDDKRDTCKNTRLRGKNLHIGDSFWAYDEDGNREDGEVISIDMQGHYIVEWENGYITDEGKYPWVAEDYLNPISPHKSHWNNYA